MGAITLLAAVALGVLIGYYTINDIQLAGSKEFQHLQIYLCMVFITDVVVDIITSPRPFHRLLEMAPFLLLSLPLWPILSYFNVAIDGHWVFVLQLLPMIRATYILIQMAGSLSSNRMFGLLAGYLSLLVMTLVFASMTVWIDERQANPDFNSYWDVLWWAFMNTTTAGCSMVPISALGKVIEVVLSALGLILFPVFTVYFTHFGTDNAQNVS